MSEWKPIETAPKDGTAVDLWIVAGKFNRRVADCRYVDDGWICHEGYIGQRFWPSAEPTHWMPLSEPPVQS